MATLSVRVSAPTLSDYRAPAPGKARNRWGCYRRGYPVWTGDDVGIYLGLVPLPVGMSEEARDARDFARAYGRDCYVAIKVGRRWERFTLPAVDIAPPTGTERVNGRIPPAGRIAVYL